MERVLFRYFSPSLNSRITFFGCGTGIYSGNLMSKIDAISETKLRAFRRKQIPAPRFSSTRPDIAGPISLARLTIDELSAMAFDRSACFQPFHSPWNAWLEHQKHLMLPAGCRAQEFPKPYNWYKQPEQRAMLPEPMKLPAWSIAPGTGYICQKSPRQAERIKMTGTGSQNSNTQHKR